MGWGAAVLGAAFIIAMVQAVAGVVEWLWRDWRKRRNARKPAHPEG